MLERRFLGRQRPCGQAPLRRDAVFLAASITKRVTATAVLLLVEYDLVSLGDPMTRYVSHVVGQGKPDVLIRHLLTHTRGVPDMQRDSHALRAADRPLADFVERACRVPLLLAPGTRVNNQRGGFALLAEVFHQVTGATLREFLREDVLDPVGMADTSLGWDPGKKEPIAAVHLDAGQWQTDWNGLTPYRPWFRSSWDDLVASPADFAG
jgi:CubicO group peptidase (beta-lactamase class C family)